jgi:ferredoxin
VISGMNKFTYHSRFSRDADFADFLVDAALAARSDFHVVDAVTGMDGDGPRVGNPIQMGIIAAGADPFALDLLMMRLVGHDPHSNRPLSAAIDRGLCPGSADELRVLGDDPGQLAVRGFRLPAKKDVGQRVPGFLMDRFGGMLSLKPKPARGRCTGCRKCADVCPGKAISMDKGTAVVDMSRCIKCYCCHELCEHDAIDLERPLLMRLIGINSG